MMDTLLNLIGLSGWAALWGLGGIWLARAAFRLQAREQVVVGLALGMLVENWLANWLARFMPLPTAAWLCAVVVFVVGFGLAWRTTRLGFTVRPGQMLLLAGIFWVMFQVCRGMAIFDDYAHLPILSIMGTGDIPPHFSFDPQVWYGYHHFLLLFCAQVMRVAGWPSWTAYDFGRAISFALAVMLAAVWTARLTRSQAAGVLGGAMLAFGSGTRWLMVFLPHRMVQWLGINVEMIGSGAGSGSSLAEAVTQRWAVSGVGPLPFPFIFANGVLTAGTIRVHNSNGEMMFVVILLLLLTFNRWQPARLASWIAAVLSVMVFSTWGLLTEAELVMLLVGWGIVTLAALIRLGWFSGRLAGLHGREPWHARFPRSLWQWLAVIACGALLAFFSGGAWTDLILKTISRVISGVAEPSYQTVGFKLAGPAVVSSHLGVLSLLDPATALVALFELGPLLLVLPLLAAFGLRAFRLNRWYEAAQAAAAVFSLVMLFVQFTGSTGVRNTPRLYVFMPLCLVFAVPLGWWWLERRSQSVRAALLGLGLTVITGGLVMFGVELTAAHRPVYSDFLTALDGQISDRYWNRLPPDALVFDPDPSRGTTVFGRFTDAAYTWFAFKPEWEQLRAAPDPRSLHAAGYDYLYYDLFYWNEMGPSQHPHLQDPCMQLLDEVSDIYGDFRRLYDLSACR